MATMVKEKSKEKKKSKSKSSSRSSIPKDIPSVPIESAPITEEICNEPIVTSSVESPKYFDASSEITASPSEVRTTSDPEPSCSVSENVEIKDKELTIESNIVKEEIVYDVVQVDEKSQNIDVASAELIETKDSQLEFEYTYIDLSRTLDRMVVQEKAADVSQEFEFLSPNPSVKTVNLEESPEIIEAVIPSAPCFEVEEIAQDISYEEVVIESKPKVQCMAIEDVMRLYSGGEMEEVRAMSEREEEIVEAGPMSGPEHPLVDLLSTFRSSLMAVERERVLLTKSISTEETNRNKLWKIEKRVIHMVEKCSCGQNVELTATYDYAELVRDMLPVAKMRLEAILRDLQDSYCHHQHEALLAYYQIEELISETIHSNKVVIREALSLVLMSLRLSGGAPDALAGALQRWAAALCAALLDHRDLRQLLFVMHHLFKQSRSVRWASRVIQVRVDIETPARILALLELLLARPRLDTAQECTEDTEDVWEEVDKHGDGGAVSEGTLRERDLLALLYALPVRDLVARILLFTHNDIKQARPHEWGDHTGGRGVLRACFGTRALIHVLRRAARTHQTYARLQRALRDVAARILHGLACLHMLSCERYSPELKDKLTSELEAAFFEGFELFDSTDTHRLPATLLADETAKYYCVGYIDHLHDPALLSCRQRVRVVAHAAVDRAVDHELARTVLAFLLQTGITRKPLPCKNKCEITAQNCLPRLFAAHPYLHTMALHIVAEMNTMEALDVSCVKVLCIPSWRPTAGEVRAVLDDWARRCPQLLQHLLLLLDCTPHLGLPLDVQLTIGSWLCPYIRDSYPGGAVPEGWWAVLRRLRPHRSAWQLPLDAPPPDEEPTDLFSTAYALLSTSWGHCIPLICSEGVSALCKLAAARPRDAVHCIAGIMLVMAHSPESVAYTPKFVEVFSSLLNSGPSLITRALGRGGAPGSEMLLRLILAQLDNEHICRSSVQSAWLHALWRASMSASALAIVDGVACASRLWPQLDAYANVLLQEENSKEHISHTVRNASTCPLLCEVSLRMCHAMHSTLVHFGYGRLLNELRRQRVTGGRIHVDNALQQVSANLTSDELVVYRAASAVLSAPMSHPAHLTLWRLLMHLYLERPPDFMSDSEPPVGPLFYSGLKKSRTLAQLKKRLQDTIIFHHNEAAALKQSIKSIQPQSTKSVSRSSSGLVDNNVVPALTIVDLTGESSNSSDLDESGEESEKERREESPSKTRESQKNKESLLCYHNSAEKMVSEYLNWLEQGDKIRAMPHHADIARFIPEHALEAAWRRSVIRPLPSEDLDSFPLPVPPPPPDNTPPQTPFHVAVDNILKIKDRSRKRHRRTEIKSPVEDVDFKDARMLVSLVDKHLKEIELLAQEWCSEVSKISALDSKLWELVGQLRVCRPLPLVKKQCEKKCPPITFDTSDKREWRLCVEAERAIQENRRTSLARIRGLARARPLAARTAAALHTVARRTRSSEAGVRVAERAWCCAGADYCGACAPARSVLTALVTNLAERWICDKGAICSKLVSAWSGRGASSLQQALCGALVAPRRLAPADWPRVYSALLTSQLPAHALFSYLSKFEMHRWCETADIAQRHEILDALLQRVQLFGATPLPEDHMLIEILGVHSALVMTSQALPSYVKSCAIMSIENKLPRTHWIHVVRGVEVNAAAVPFEQLGHLLRELGVLWWEARTGVKTPTCNVAHLAEYTPYVATLLHVLQRAFVAAAIRLSYEPERVAWYAWSTLQESWGAWISPHAGSPPLLSSTSTDEQYTTMLRHFVDNVHQIMLDCPGTEIYLLQQIFEWCVPTYVNVQLVPSVTSAPGVTNTSNVVQESRVQASALLAELAKLPWYEHQWFYGKSLQVALQMSSSTEHELTSWCCSAFRSTTAETLVRDAGEHLVPRLASLLYLFTGTLLPLSQQILDEACKLPWLRLPELALEEALDRFYRLHHSAAQPYHDLPQFRLILLACELAVPPHATSVQLGPSSRSKRCLGVSCWVRAAAAPPLAPHVAAHSARLLHVLAELVPQLSSSEGELEELLCRALVVMCIEPAASAALPVWISWISDACVRLSVASVRAAATLTAREHAAAIGDAAVKSALLLKAERASWPALSAWWCGGHWREASALAARARLHAAYACALAHAREQSSDTLATLYALPTAPIHFIDNEPIVAVWICYSARLARSDEQQISLSARALLARWAEVERRSLLSRVTMQASTDKPTPLHRILCRYAQYILSPDDNTRKAFEYAFTSTLTSTSDLQAWTVAPQHNKLVTLAIRLFPKHDNYFSYELNKS